MPKYAQAVLDVDFSRLLPEGKSLKDGATLLRVVVDVQLDIKDNPESAHVFVIPNERIGFGVTDQKLYENANMCRIVNYLPELKPTTGYVERDGTFVVEASDDTEIRFAPIIEDGWMKASFKRVCGIATTFALPKRIKRLLYLQLVDLRATSTDAFWQAPSVFFNGDPGVHEKYLKKIKQAGVHALGRVALMHKILFTIAGINSSTPGNLVSIIDSWSGRLTVSPTNLVETARAVVRENGDYKEDRTVVTKLLDTLEPITVVINSADLMHHNKIIASSKELQKVVETIKRELFGDHTELRKKYDEAIEALIPHLYKEMLAEKMKGSAVTIGKQPEKIDTTLGIYGVYSKLAESKEGLFFERPPHAVSASFRRVRDHATSLQWCQGP